MTTDLVPRLSLTCHGQYTRSGGPNCGSSGIATAVTAAARLRRRSSSGGSAAAAEPAATRNRTSTNALWEITIAVWLFETSRDVSLV
jgi:hypothetical protein